jgi:hypothetical protein
MMDGKKKKFKNSKNEFIFFGKKKLFVLLMWKLTLGYGNLQKNPLKETTLDN